MDDLHAEVEIKAQLKPRDSMAKNEDPNPPHQLCKLQITSMQSTRKILCPWNIYKKIESSHKRKHTNADGCGIGGKNIQEEDQIRI